MASNLLTAVILACSLSLAGASTARAHAMLDHADPGVGSTQPASPKQVRIWFSEAINPASSAIAVTDEAGRQVGQGKAIVDADDAKLLELTLPLLPPGAYRVIWRAVTPDAHRSEGHFTFKVGP